MINTKFKFYYRLSLTTVIAVFILILAGGVVRSTGSGMGCPDWPKCFGSWVPPTKLEQLPENYKEVYADFRHKKNEKFAVYLSFLGMHKVAEGILNDESILVEADFNAVKTWTEYINRLIGALVGFFILLMAFASLKFYKEYRTITIMSVATLFVVIFQGWIGSIVVSTNLLPWLITIHMLLALLIVLMLFYLFEKSRLVYRNPITVHNAKSLKNISALLVIGMLMLLIQIVLGTQVREEIDLVTIAMGESLRNSWVENLGAYFLIHRSFSWLILISIALVAYLLIKQSKEQILVASIVSLILLSFLSGVGMAYFGVPAWLQPLHLLVATIAFGLIFLLVLRLRQNSITTDIAS
ncbi:MAG TPA: COX15/CtaA family protein [Cyclobacteriaceae bacterium]|nr:COX15/CtaA family protein [Cyclobacteriaceae bacterium]